MQVKIQTKNTSTPQLALLDAIGALKQVIVSAPLHGFFNRELLSSSSSTETSSQEFKHLDSEFKDAVSTYQDQASQGAMDY